MSSVKCQNYTGCLLAYKGEEIQLPPGAPLVCPECGKPVTPISGGGGMMKWIIIGGVLVFLVVGGIAALVVVKKVLPNLRGGKGAPTPAATDPQAAPAEPTEPTATPEPPSTEPILPSTPTPPTTADTPKPQDDIIGTDTPEPVKETPPATPVAPEPPKPTATEEKPADAKPTVVQNVDTSLDNEANQKVKQDVLKRIDLMPNISATNKDKLYNSVNRARGMGMVLQIPFGSGRTTLPAPEIAALKTSLEDPKLMKLRDDPTAVFVVLGYADTKGDDAKNIAVSQARADSVVNAMRDKANIANVTHAVAMGGSTLHDATKLESNRVVEVWAVLP